MTQAFASGKLDVKVTSCLEPLNIVEQLVKRIRGSTNFPIKFFVKLLFGYHYFCGKNTLIVTVFSPNWLFVSKARLCGMENGVDL